MAFNSWPAWLSRISGRSVYNLALGGWGPIQYEYLLRNRALQLKPSVVILGLYFGNDIFDAYRVVYGLDFWRDLRIPEHVDLISPYVSVERPNRAGPFRRMRIWLSQNSVLYRLVVSAFGNILGPLDMRIRGVGGEISILDDEDLHTAFTPLMRLGAVDLERPEVREGLRLTLESLERVILLCEREKVKLVVLLIPTKESVFAERLVGRSEIANADSITALLEAEDNLRNQLREYLEERNVIVVDPRESLRRAAKHEPIYPSNEGGHPVSAGYRAIAETLAPWVR